MPRTVTSLVLLVFLSQGFSLELEETLEDCDDVLLSDDNGTLYQHSYYTQSVKFYFLTPENDTILLNSTNLGLFNFSQPTKFIIHGLGAYEDHVWIDKMAAVYHTNGDYNIIAVDWSVLSVQAEDYMVDVIDGVGNIVGTFIMEITKSNVDYLSDIHLIGSSIGAHVGGAAGETISDSDRKVGRITGLDPGIPQNPEILDENDAQFVDVIHTSVELGQASCGRVDFYVLDGEKPVCLSGSNTTNSGCVELLGSEYYIMTIEDKYRFYGVSCQNVTDDVRELCDKAVMGEFASWNVSGNYRVSKDSAAGMRVSGVFVFSCLVALLQFK